MSFILQRNGLCKIYISLYRHFIYVRLIYYFYPSKSPLFPQKSNVNFRKMLLTCVSEQASMLCGPLTLQAVRPSLPPAVSIALTCGRRPTRPLHTTSYAFLGFFE
jgi:hypothetical protein